MPLGTLLLLCGLYPYASAGEQEELAELAMFFDEEQLVESATRAPKPLSQVAEDVTIITAAQIEKMNAHTVADVLARVPGVFVQFNGRDFAGQSSIHIHSSNYEHVLVLLDGIRWNDISSEFNETNTIPVRIIERIEVVKGAASSTWGSALGGVVNIITKRTGNNPVPSGTVRGTYGERGTQSYDGEVKGAVGLVGYYLYGGDQRSDGLYLDRTHDNENLYVKLAADLPGKSTLTLTAGHSDPDTKAINASSFAWQTEERVYFYTANFDAPLAETVNFNVSFNYYDEESTSAYLFSTTGDPFAQSITDSSATSVNGRLVWNHANQTVVLGSEFNRTNYTILDTITPYESAKRYDEFWAVYVNDTICLDKLTITPGIRFDHHAIAQDLVNPSLGATYRLSDNTLLRAAVTRGFRKTPIALKFGDPVVSGPQNPSLEPEKVWTYQAGVEAIALEYIRLKATFFEHNEKDVWEFDRSTFTYVNGGKVRRDGVEFELETIPVFDIALLANYTYVYSNYRGAQDNDSMSGANIIFQYDDNKSFNAQLAGRYVWWNDELSSNSGNFDDMIWDFTLNKQVLARHNLRLELLFSAHNIFNGAQYWHSLYPNAPRWIEGGVKLHF